MAGRKVGQGRGSVYAGGAIYLEGAEIPDDVAVDPVVFTDADDEPANVAAPQARRVVGPEDGKRAASRKRDDGDGG